MSSQRQNLAQELHDGIAQELVALGFSLDRVIAKFPTAENKKDLRTIRFAIADLIEKVRLEIYQLRTVSDNSKSLADSTISFELNRVVAEIIRNIERHSHAKKISISISDDGLGGAHVKNGSFGLIGIQERIKNFNGEIAIESNQN